MPEKEERPGMKLIIHTTNCITDIPTCMSIHDIKEVTKITCTYKSLKSLSLKVGHPKITLSRISDINGHLDKLVVKGRNHHPIKTITTGTTTPKQQPDGYRKDKATSMRINLLDK